MIDLMRGKPGTSPHSRQMAVLATVMLLGSTAFTVAPAVSTAATTTLSGFVVAGDGRLYRIAPSAGSSGPGMTRLNNTVVAPPGAAISAIRQPDGTLALFFIGNHGGLVAATTSVTGAELTMFNVTPALLAPAGGKISATVAANTNVHVFFPGSNGTIYAVSFGQRVGPQPVPWLAAVTVPGTAPPFASIAAVWSAQPYVTPGALFIGVDGGLHAVWQQASGAWTTFAVSPPDVAPPGGSLTALSTQGLPVQGFFVGKDGTLWRIDAGPRPEPWQPQAISPAGAAPPGAALSAVRFGAGPQPWRPAAVFFVAANGAVHVATNPETAWLAPAPTTTPGAANPGGPITAILDPTGELSYVAWCGNDIWWWLRWRTLVPPPPPPPWYGERFSISATTIRPHFHPATATWGT